MNVVASALPPVPVAPPRRQRHRRRGRARPTRRGPAPAADGARRRGREERLRLHRAALRGGQRPRGDLPGAAGGGGLGRRQGRQRPLGPEEMDTRCFGRFQGAKKKSNSTCEMKCKTLGGFGGFGRF